VPFFVLFLLLGLLSVLPFLLVVPFLSCFEDEEGGPTLLFGLAVLAWARTRRSFPMIADALFSHLDIDAGMIEGAALTRRRLSDLEGIFFDTAAYARAVSQGNPLIYTVSAIDRASGDGALHYALGSLLPGRIGREYFMTKGHYHAWREAAEVYVGLSGEGVMLLENESSESALLPLKPKSIVYVPGRAAHRTINTGTKPLVYLGVYPARAGHDYAAIAAKNFRNVVLEQDGATVMRERATFAP
jgi:glucose-6-phosphate isomerase, archaeal